MGMQSWKREFYKGKLRDAARSAEAATEHSLLKWSGLTKQNLEAHGIEATYSGNLSYSLSGAFFEIDASTCALCSFSVNQMDKQNREILTGEEEGEEEYNECKFCPIVLAGNKACDNQGSAWRAWTDRGDAIRMIKVLTVTKDSL